MEDLLEGYKFSLVKGQEFIGVVFPLVDFVGHREDGGALGIEVDHGFFYQGGVVSVQGGGDFV